MSVILDQETERVIAAEIEAGRSANADEFIRRAIRHFLIAREFGEEYTIEEIDAKISRGLASLDAGEGTDGEAASPRSSMESGKASCAASPPTFLSSSSAPTRRPSDVFPEGGGDEGRAPALSTDVIGTTEAESCPAGRTLALSYSIAAVFYYRVIIGWVTVAHLGRKATELALRSVPFVFQGPAITAIYLWPEYWPL